MSETSEAEKAAPSKGGKLVTILALVNFVAVLGLGGYLVYTQQHAAAQSKASAKAGGGKQQAHGEGGHGEEAAPAEGGHGEEAGDGHGEKAAGGGHGAPARHAPEPADDGEGHGPLLALESMVTNLADPDTDRYLKVTMQVRLTSEAAKAEVETHLVPVRNQILLYLSSLSIEDLSGADNKRGIQKRVKRIANEAMPSSRITQVYFTEFVIQ